MVRVVIGCSVGAINSKLKTQNVLTVSALLTHRWLKPVLITVLLFLALWLLQRRMQPAGYQVEVNPLEHMSQQELVAALQLKPDGRFRDLDIAAIRERLEKQAWVERAQVQRIWPNRLKIHIWEQAPAAYWVDAEVVEVSPDAADALLFANGSEAQLVNEEGKMIRLKRNVNLPAGLPHLSGPEGSQKDVLKAYQDLRAIVERAGLQVRGLWVDKRGAWALLLDNNIVVYLGREAMLDRAQRFIDVAMVKLRTQLAKVKYVDMRYSNGFATGWRSDIPSGATGDTTSASTTDTDTSHATTTP